MILSPLADPARLPRPADAERVALGHEHWQEVAARCDDATLARFATDLAADGAGRAVLDAVFGNSPFLTRCMLQDLGIVRDLLTQGADRAFAATLDRLEGLAVGAATIEELMAALRRAKGRVALTVALADISGHWGLEAVTRRLSRFADASMRAATGFLLRDADTRGVLRLPNGADPEHGSGYVVLAMGKLGANELNYSSDIDLIVVYDADKVVCQRPNGMQQAFVRLTRSLVKVLEERTADGYVFRTDLRLRPDPAATPLAISMQAAETYYESIGQNWERAAMIKVRPAAGDLASGHDFVEALRPFVWRRSLDFAAIQDIHSIKRQIHAHKGGSTVALMGHNIKLGRGGIREIEFFAQTQQLIWGGREPELRTAGTLDSLRGLTALGRVQPEVAAEMTEAYRVLRRVEHRLQMIDDQQTQTLPSGDQDFAALATFLGYDDAEGFAGELLRHLHTVEHHYAELFEDSAPLGSSGSLVFTGSEHDPDTLETLAGMGYAEPETVSGIVRSWHHGRYRATRSTRSREILTELMPRLLEAVANTANPDQALRRFDVFLEALPAGVQLFSLFHSNQPLLGLVAEIMGGAPRLATWLSRNPLLLDGVLDPSFHTTLPDEGAMTVELHDKLVQARDMQDVLDLTRRWANDAKFQVGVQILRHITDIDRAGRALSDIADTVIDALLPHILTEFAERHGRCPGDGLAVVALGKLGSHELTATSDLDLVLVYDQPEAAAQSDGAKPLPVALYYQRVGQRLITALTAMTGEGKLFDVDMRLRPSGSKGPIAVSVDAFLAYQREQAWTWEHMALTRARVVRAGPGLRARIEQTIRTVLCAPRDADALLLAVDNMRLRIAQEHPAAPLWAVKHHRGGLVDCEFIAQYLQLRHAQAHPEVLSPHTTTALANLKTAGVLTQDEADRLIAATNLWRRLQGVLRLEATDAVEEAVWPTAVKTALARAGEAADFDSLKAKAEDMAGQAQGLYQSLIADPAAEIRARTEQPEGDTADGA